MPRGNETVGRMAEDGKRGEGESRRNRWKVIAWFVGTAIALAGVTLAALDYVNGRQSADKEEKAARAQEEEKLNAARAAARRPMATVCARTRDVVHSNLAITQALTDGAPYTAPNYDALREDLRELDEAANETTDNRIETAAFLVRTGLERLGSLTPTDKKALSAVIKGYAAYGTLVTECERQGFAFKGEVQELMDSLPKNAYLGVKYGQDAAGGGGAVVAAVHTGAAADRAGLRAGDIIVSFDGARIGGSASLAAALNRAAVGQSVRLVFWRNGVQLQAVAAPSVIPRGCPCLGWG